MTTALRRPALRYHGGKWRIAPWIVAHFPRHRVYTEAYGGAASVLMRKRRCYSEVYNDLDGDVVNVFRVFRDRDQAAELERLLRLTPFARGEFSLAYEPTDDPVERARRAIVRSFQGFGSDSIRNNRVTGFRSNSNRKGTVPAVDWARYPDVIRSFTARMQGVLIDCRPALEVLTEHDKAITLHYVDPPYVRSTRNRRKGYRVEMDDDAHRQLAERLHALRGFVVLSGYASPLYDGLYPDWLRVERPVRAFNAARRVECLWLNDRAAARLKQKSFSFGE